jgi:hypothetical protein
MRVAITIERRQKQTEEVKKERPMSAEKVSVGSKLLVASGYLTD